MRIWSIIVFLPLAACGTTPTQPALKPLDAVSAAARPQNPVILVHGLLGARLRTTDTRKEIWPGPLTNFIVNRSKALAFEIDPETLRPLAEKTEAYALFGRVMGRSRHAQILRALEKTGAYTLAAPGRRPAGPAYYIFLYDWRRDLVKTAAELDRFIEQIRRDYGDPKLRVDIIAYSMGGLVTQYFLRYGGRDVLASDTFEPDHAGAAKTSRAVLIGAPNAGSAGAVEAFVKGYRLGLATVRPEVIATMPAAYQLLPPPDRDWAIDADGKIWNRDLYSVETWREHQWSIFDPKVRARIGKRFATEEQAQRYLETLVRYFERNLQRARRFHQALSQPLGGAGARYIVVGGQCVPTPARCVVEKVGGRTRIRCRPTEVVNRAPGVNYAKLMLEPGDGRVTRTSLLAQRLASMALSLGPEQGSDHGRTALLCERHDRLMENSAVQDRVLGYLRTRQTQFDAEP